MTSVALQHPVPDFTVPATSQKTITLSDFRGQNVVLYFYPKDATPGCTIESQDFAANHESIRQTNTVIFGISRDTLESHEDFRASQLLPFELISDADEVLCNLFEVIHSKPRKDGTFLGVARSTFLIDSDGILVREWRDIKVKGHVHEVLRCCRELATEKTD